MDPSQWFDDLPVLGRLPPETAAEKLREVGEEESATALEEALHEDTRATTFGKGWGWPFQTKPWQHTAHAFGFLEPAAPGTGPRPIQHVSNVSADASLKNSRIKITLDHLRVADYPGRGTHRILFDYGNGA